jgi:spore coat polysaccharide biosynthesis protein SpsF
VTAVKTIAIVEARMTSRRLPGKVLKPFLGRPALSVLVRRLARARSLHGVVIATTVNATDDPIVELARAEDVGVHRGSEEDVLGRVLGAARESGADVIVEITGDCPFLDPAIVDRCAEHYLRGSYDFVANTVPESDDAYPTGMDVRVFSTALLARLDARTRAPRDREHVSLHFWEHPGEYRLGFVPAPSDLRWPGLCLVLDEPSDYEMLREVYAALSPKTPEFGLREILDYLRARPELVERNRLEPRTQL